MQYVESEKEEGNGAYRELRKLYHPYDLTPYDQLLFYGFFPFDSEPQSFNPKSIEYVAAADPRENKVIRSLVMKYYGLISPREKMYTGPHDVRRLHVAFTDDPRSLTGQLNRLEDIERINRIGQTEPHRSSELMPDEDILNQSRGDHSKHFARIVTQTNIRLALINPELYIERVEEDMQRYSRLHSKDKQEDPGFGLEPKSETIHLIATLKNDFSMTAAQEAALGLAIEYGKYFMIYAYLHDVFTPGWGDNFMKAKAVGEDQESANYSEDDALANHIKEILNTSLAPIVQQHGLNKDLLEIMVKKYATNDDCCLGGYLMKDKRKYTEDTRQAYPWLPTAEAYDHDQMSGTITNLELIVNKLLPRGFRHIEGKPLPTGSFEERLRLLTYMLATGKSREWLIDKCAEKGVDVDGIFIAAEEVGVGRNLILKKVKTHPDYEEEEIMPVCADPGAVKRAILAFNFLQAYYYRSSPRSTIEAALKEAIACGLFDKTLTRDVFIGKDDYQVNRYMEKEAPVLLHIRDILQRQARIMTQEELADLAGIPDTWLVRKADMGGLIQRKSGTYVVDYDGNILPYAEVITNTRLERIAGAAEPNIYSIPVRLDMAEEAVDAMATYYVFPLSEYDRHFLEKFFNMSRRLNQSVERALNNWLVK